MSRLPASEKTRQSILSLLEEGSSPKGGLFRQGVQRIIEEILEGKVEEMLKRGYYAHRQDDEPEGYRNGYRQGRLKTGEGEVRFSVPQVRDTDGTPLREMKKQLSGRTETLDDLAIEMYSRGLSTRDIEALWADSKGQPMLSKNSVCEITERLWIEYEAFATRDLSSFKLYYLFVDGIAERLTPGFRREAVLCAWGIMETGEKILLHISPGTKESTDCVKEFFQDMRRRGLPDPILVVSDGAPGIIRGIEECFPHSKRQRCLFHKMQNISSKLSDIHQKEFVICARACYQAPSKAVARMLAKDLRERFEGDCPTAVRCFEDDFEACIAHLDCPIGHRRFIRTTNMLERLFGEERRRLKVMPTISGEKPILKLMFASLIRASDRWKGIRINEFEHQQLAKLREEIREEAIKIHESVVKSTTKPGSTQNGIYSKNRT